jgi:hypothetical protein
VSPWSALLWAPDDEGDDHGEAPRCRSPSGHLAGPARGARLPRHPTVAATVEAFHTATTAHYKAKDILRAARLPLLPETNPHVRSDLAKVHDGRPLSPVLIVRGDASAGYAAQIADGYHRVCASYLTDENTDVPVRLVDLAAPRRP